MFVSLFLLSAIVGLVTYIVYKVRKRLNYWNSVGIACEKPHWLLGNINGFMNNLSLADICANYYKKFKGTGPFAGFHWFQRQAVFVLDTSLIKNILIKDFNKFTDRGFFSNVQDDPLSGQIFLLEGHKWRNMRNKLSSTFTSGKMKYMFPTVIKLGRELVNVFGNYVEKDCTVEVTDLMARFTIDVIGTCAFGLECNSLNDPDTEFRVMGRKAFSEMRHGMMHAAFLMNYPKLARKLHMKQTPEQIEKFYMGIVRETIDYREKNHIRRNDFMDMMIELKNNKIMKSENGEELTNLTFEEVAAQAFVFLTGGFETSSTTMGFALYELAQNEDIQRKAREEIESVLASHNQEFTYECMKELVYLNQIISETLRLYTVIPFLSRQCLEDYAVPDQPNFVIKKGMLVLIPTGAIHRDEQYYANPDVFNPDNFLPDIIKQRDSVEWLAFGEGPRNCIGMRFGQMQARIGLTLLLKHFKFSVCPKTQIPIQYNKKNFLICSEEGIYLKVEKI